MDTCSDHGEQQFFDALEEIDILSDLGLDCPENLDSDSSSTQFDVWIKNPESVQSRRSKFFNWLGLDVKNKIFSDDSETSSDFEGDIDRIRSSDGAMLRSTSFEYEFSSSRSSILCWSGDNSEFTRNLDSKDNVICQNGDLDGEMAGNVGDQNQESGLDISVMTERIESSSSSSSSIGDYSPAKNTITSCSVGPAKRVKKWWMSKLRSFTCVTERDEGSLDCDSSIGAKIQRVKVHQSKKQSKELSALYFCQDIRAHKGAILAMKFSHDGQFLASAGEDRVVRIWQVVEDDRLNEHDIPDMDMSSVYFTMNHLSELKPVSTDKEKNGKLRRTCDSACVILPPKVFRILEKPLHEFQGHTGEILDLSWSKNNFLLSSSVDRTVRLWQVGFNHCLKVFPHNNYVTCIQFNPVNDNYFISGSIDGKVRIWETSQSKVVTWTEIKDIVTAVCYSPDGQGGIIGLITGSCRFYSISDNHLQLDARIFLHNKKKSSGKRITGFQFFPQDPSKVMVSSADSQVRILQGVDVIGKYKGLRSSGAYSSAYLTSDGKHIVSACEDSNVYIWKSADHDYGNPSHVKKVKSSERFLSNASVAIPWPGFQNESRGNTCRNGLDHGAGHLFSPAHFSCGQDLFLESNSPKGSALWPEEKLISQSRQCVTSSMHKSEYKFLRTCQNKSDSHAWGMVIVTAGWDGRIRSFHNYGLPVPR